jgi:hypothetical protein
MVFNRRRTDPAGNGDRAARQARDLLSVMVAGTLVSTLVCGLLLWRPLTLERVLNAGQDLQLSLLPQQRDYDAVLASTLARGPFVTGFHFDFGATASRDCMPRSTSITLLSRTPDLSEAAPRLHSAPGVLCNVRRLHEAARSGGFINGRPDDDGIYRPIPPDPLFTGVELHASVVDNILPGDYLARPRAGPALELACALASGLAFSLASVRRLQEHIGAPPILRDLPRRTPAPRLPHYPSPAPFAVLP